MNDFRILSVFSVYSVIQLLFLGWNSDMREHDPIFAGLFCLHQGLV
jgi:hypothetical protein